MNNRERFVRAHRFQSVDRAPNIELGVWEQAIDRWRTEGMPRDIHMQAFFGPGNVYFGIDRREALPIKLDMQPAFDEVTLYEDDEVRVYMSIEGSTHKAMKKGEVRGTRTSMDQYLESAVKNRSDFLEMKKRYDPSSSVRYPQYWDDYVRWYRDRDYPLCLADVGHWGLYSGLRRWMGTEAACLVFYDDPSLAEEMLDCLVDLVLETGHRALHDVDVDYFNIWEDFACKSGPLVSPRLYQKFLLPRYRKITDFLRSHGVDIVHLDSDGNVEALLPLIIKSGINCLWPLERAAGMDPIKVRKEYGKELVLSGGIDKREIALGKKEIEDEVFRLAPLIEDGGFLPQLDHAFPHDISYENFLYYLEVKRKLVEGRYGAS